MSKAILEFSLPDEKPEFEQAVKGAHYDYALHELDQHLRARLKYEDLSEEVREALEKVREKLWELKNNE